MQTHPAIRLQVRTGHAEAQMNGVERRMAALTQQYGQRVTGQPSTAAQAAAYHLAAGGQRLRARLAVHAALASGLDDTDGISLTVAAELLHNASLIHDDLQDRSTMRRGIDTVWAAFGDNVAICAGDLLLSAAYGALSQFSDASKLPALIALVHERTSVAIRGQCADLYAGARTSRDIGGFEEIAVAKSGALLSLPLELAFRAAGFDAAALAGRKAAETFAIGYQIADDIADWIGDSGNSSVPCSFNAVQVFEAAGYGGTALAEARSLGLKRLGAAAAIAGGLPNGSGTLLRDLALQLAASLSKTGMPA